MEIIIRLSFFFGLFVLFAIAERFFPKQKPHFFNLMRWRTNWSLTAINTLTLRVMALGMPLLAVGAAIDAKKNNWGIFNLLDMPIFLEGIFAILLLDLIIWFQHFLTHKIPILWRLHRVHHADVGFDVTTAIRFHPIEIAFSMVVKIGAVYMLGISVFSVIAFEVLLNGSSLFNHANIKIPKWLDNFLRLFIVTPDMHRIHHSDKRSDHDSNYGFNLSIWDKIFGTYKGNAEFGDSNIIVGLVWQDKKPAKLLWSLWLPFIRK
tara:strand:- start:409 stop:1197 length:789 start_codon:yes stop_codon:yes gene_type:complete